MQMKKKNIEARVVLILICLGIFCGCFWYMNQTYDPLARYPYATDENRDILLQYLDSDDIDYIISNQIRPEEFIEFIDEEGFNIRYCRLYSIAKQTQDQSNAYIVNFVNRFRQHFSTSTLKTLLEHYSYVDLTTFYENEAIRQEPLKLIADPSQPFVILKQDTSVYKYVPSNLVSVGTISLHEKAADAFERMESAYQSMLGNDASLSLVKGYMPYDQIFTEYTSLSQNHPDIVDQIFMPAGQNEFQLGYTVALQGYQEWIDALMAQENTDYETIIEAMDESLKIKMTWLEENAYRYGFVIRYPQDKESVTQHLYNPFLLRYVGVENARELHENDKAMEEIKLSEE